MRFAVGLLSFLAIGCATRQSAVDAHPEWSQEIKAKILRAEVEPGMTEEMLMAAWGSSKADMTYTRTETGIFEIWYFKNSSNEINYGLRTCPFGRYAVRLESRRSPDGSAVMIVTSITGY